MGPKLYIDLPPDSSNRVMTADFIFALWGKGIEISQHWLKEEEARVTGGKKLNLSSKLHSGPRVNLKRRERKGRGAAWRPLPGQLITRREHFKNS